MEALDELVALVRQARRGVVFTGAGISTESGIPDFRSPGGIWSREKPVMYDDFLRDRGERVRYWRMRQAIYRDTQRAKPNAGHHAVAALQRLGHVRAVITQNIDGLHQDAGSAPVIELHGTNRVIACQQCAHEWEPAEIIARLDAGDEAPDCDHCGGPLKSRTISFGQAMPATEMEQALSLSLDADLFLSMGSSLVVEPAASFPRIACQAGAPLVIINRTPTPLDGVAATVIRGSIGAVMSQVVEGLNSHA